MSGRTSVWVHEFLSARLLSRVFCHMGCHAEFDCCWSNATSIHTEIRRKNWTPHVPPFQGQPRLLNGHESIVYI